MVLYGQRKLLLLVSALVGPCLATVGCQSDLGLMGPSVIGGSSVRYTGDGGRYATGPSMGGSGTAFTYPPGVPRPVAPAAPVVQASYQNPGGPLADQNGQPPADAAPLPPCLPNPWGPCPTELNKVSHPPYTIAPPDILSIEALKLVPKPPYRVEPLEILTVEVSGTIPKQPIKGSFTVAPDGTINLGFGYGSVLVAAMTLEQIQNAIRTHLNDQLKSPQVSVSLAQYRAMPQLGGKHLVRPDGTIDLGAYGSVYVAGLTLSQAKGVIEEHLSGWILNPEIAINVGAYNSKVYYVVVDYGSWGQEVFRFPITGNETVLDAITMIDGLPPVASRHRLWLARPAPPQYGCDQILPIDWMAIVSGASTATNYQLFPGDRLFISANQRCALCNWLAQCFAPIKRVFGGDGP